MRILQVGFLSFGLMLVFSLPALSQNSTSPSPQVKANDASGQSEGTLSPPPPASFNDVMERVVQKEHLFLAQMRHMRPMVETYLQDLKTDSEGKAVPTKD